MSKITANAAAAAPAAFDAIPLRRVGGRWITFFALGRFGVWIAQPTPVQPLLPAPSETQLATTDWIRTVLAFGTTSRWGRRRPWIATGTVGFAAALLLLGVQTFPQAIGIIAGLVTTLALATQALPSQLSHGKDLGILTIALPVPLAFAAARVRNVK